MKRYLRIGRGPGATDKLFVGIGEGPTAMSFEIDEATFDSIIADGSAQFEQEAVDSSDGLAVNQRRSEAAKKAMAKRLNKSKEASKPKEPEPEPPVEPKTKFANVADIGTYRAYGDELKLKKARKR